MSRSTIDALWDSTSTGTLDTEALGDVSLDDGQTMQTALLARWIAAGEQLAGYKIGLTSGIARNAFGKGVRPFGFILKSRVYHSGDTIERATIGRLGLENELVFRIGQSLHGDAKATDARDAVEAVAPGFEINQMRTRGNVSNGIRIADNLSQWGIVIGDWQSPDYPFASLEVAMDRDGETLERVVARDHIDDHFESIATLTNTLKRFGRVLEPGMLVITGSFTRQTIELPGTYTGQFGELGSVRIRVR